MTSDIENEESVLLCEHEASPCPEEDTSNAFLRNSLCRQAVIRPLGKAKAANHRIGVAEEFDHR